MRFRTICGGFITISLTRQPTTLIPTRWWISGFVYIWGCFGIKYHNILRLLYTLYCFTNLLEFKSWSQFLEEAEQFLRYNTPVIWPHFMLRYPLIYFTTKLKYVKADHVHWTEQIMCIGPFCFCRSKYHTFPILTGIHSPLSLSRTSRCSSGSSSSVIFRGTSVLPFFLAVV